MHQRIAESPVLPISWPGDDAVLRPWRAADVARFWALTESNRARLSVWLGWPDSTHGEADVAAFIAATRTALDSGEGCDLALEIAGQPVGGVGLCEIDQTNNTATMGYWIDREWEVKGLVAGACRAILRHAFDDLAMARVELWNMAGNARSRALAQRLSFHEEGILRARVIHRGQRHDRVVYGLPREAWRRER